MEPFSATRIFILLIATVMIIIGTSVPHIFLPNRTLYLYKGKYFGRSIDHNKFPFQCDATEGRWNAAFGFAILACIAIGSALITATIAAFVVMVSKIMKIVSTGLTLLGFIASLITFAIVVNLYEGTHCGYTVSMKDRGYELDIGAGFIIATWCLLFFDFVIGILSILGIGKKE